METTTRKQMLDRITEITDGKDVAEQLTVLQQEYRCNLDYIGGLEYDMQAADSDGAQALKAEIDAAGWFSQQLNHVMYNLKRELNGTVERVTSKERFLDLPFNTSHHGIPSMTVKTRTGSYQGGRGLR